MKTEPQKFAIYTFTIESGIIHGQNPIPRRYFEVTKAKRIYYEVTNELAAEIIKSSFDDLSWRGFYCWENVDIENSTVEAICEKIADYHGVASIHQLNEARCDFDCDSKSIYFVSVEV